MEIRYRHDGDVLNDPIGHDRNVMKARYDPLDEQGHTRVTIGGQTVDLTIGSPLPGHVVLTLDGRRRPLWTARGDRGAWIWAEGQAVLIEEVQDDRISHGPGAAGLGLAVTPPMPAVVVRLLVEVGQAVEARQGLVVISAMKMEMTLVAPHRGMVRAIHTRVGDNVNPGDILVDIESLAGEERDHG